MAVSSTDEASPDCAIYVRKTEAGDTSAMTSFACVPTATTIVVLVDSTGSASTQTPSVGLTIRGSRVSSYGSSDSSETSGTNGGGLSQSDKVAIGVGLKVGIPTLVVAIVVWLCPCMAR
jgi:hypothetical protein